MESEKYRILNRTPTADSLIAATAMGKNDITVTDDPHFMQIDGLRAK
ncbi:MAG TPA: hypothetical protein VJ044_01115 [Candidatus Hodarchaeales archaeon]|nr:hypothetical protein [Candidatus Hodarchaeales archaeon]